MTTPEQIIAKIEEIESLLVRPKIEWEDREKRIQFNSMVQNLFSLKQSTIAYYNLPTADPPEGSPGQEDMEG